MCFGNWGSSSLDLHIIELCNYIEIENSDSFWEIGVGVPLLAFSLSAAAFDGVVLGTDLGKLIPNKNKL